MEETKKKGPKPSPIKSKQKSIKIREDLEEVFMDSLYELRRKLYKLHPRVIYTRDFKDWRDSNFKYNALVLDKWVRNDGSWFNANELEDYYIKERNKSPFANGGKK